MSEVSLYSVANTARQLTDSGRVSTGRGTRPGKGSTSKERDQSTGKTGRIKQLESEDHSSIEEQPLRRNAKRFRGGLVSKAHRLVYHSTLGARVIHKTMKEGFI